MVSKEIRTRVNKGFGYSLKSSVASNGRDMAGARWTGLLDFYLYNNTQGNNNWWRSNPVYANFATNKIYNTICCRAASSQGPTQQQGSDLFDETRLDAQAATKTLPSTTAALVWAQRSTALPAMVLTVATVLSIFTLPMQDTVTTLLPAVGVAIADINNYYPLSSYNVITSNTAIRIASDMGYNLSDESSFNNLMPSDTPPSSEVNLFSDRQTGIDDAICRTTVIRLQNTTLSVAARSAQIANETWWRESVCINYGVPNSIPKPNQEVFDAMSSNTLQELVNDSTLVGERLCQFLFSILMARFPAAIPERFWPMVTQDRTAFRREFAPWISAFVGQENRAAKYIRVLYTYLRESASSADKYDFGCTTAEKGACLLLSGICNKITARASQITASNRLVWSKAKLQAVVDFEASSIAELERDFPVFRISRIIFNDIPTGLQTKIIDTIMSFDKAAGQRSKSLALRAWKAMEYIRFVGITTSTGYDPDTFVLLCEKPLKNIIASTSNP